MVWWSVGLMGWRSDDLTVWRSDGLTCWWSDGLMVWRANGLTHGLTVSRSHSLTVWRSVDVLYRGAVWDLHPVHSGGQRGRLRRPHTRQRPDHCGEHSAQLCYSKWNVKPILMLAKMNVLSLITLPISTNYTTIYRGHGAKNAAMAHCRP